MNDSSVQYSSARLSLISVTKYGRQPQQREMVMICVLGFLSMTEEHVCPVAKEQLARTVHIIGESREAGGGNSGVPPQSSPKIFPVEKWLVRFNLTLHGIKHSTLSLYM